MNSLIIGFGKMGMLHASILKSLEDIRAVAVSESSAFIRDGLKTMNPAIPVYSSHREALKSQNFDLAVVATPNDSHLELFQDLFERNISVFVEKPFVTSFSEAKVAQKLVEKKSGNVPRIMVGYCLRFVPAFERAKAILSSGALGKILHFEAKMFSSDVETAQSGWRFDRPAKGGGVLLDLGSHLIDLTRYFFGMPESVMGFTKNWYSRHVEDYFHAVFNYGALSGVVEASWSVPGIRKPAAEFFVLGENGQMTVSNDSLNIHLKSASAGLEAGRTSYDATDFSQPVPFDLAGPFYTRQFMEFIDAVKKNSSNRNGLLESVENHCLIDAIRESDHRPIRIKERLT